MTGAQFFYGTSFHQAGPLPVQDDYNARKRAEWQADLRAAALSSSLKSTAEAPRVPTAYEIAARWRKATKLAIALNAVGIDAESMSLANEAEWATAAQAARVKSSSAETRAVVMEILREMEAVRG